MNTILIIINLILSLAIIYLLSRKSKTNSSLRRILLDTSVLIDGRIYDLAKTGFLNDELIIPRSVIAELQLLADNADNQKRTRGRFGLDLIAKLQRLDAVSVTIFQDKRFTPEGVDNRLLELAKNHHFALATIDYNLNKVATVEQITVLNINELVKVLKTNLLPGEIINLKLIQPGQSPDQAIGYLPDGSMVVVANAKKFINKTIEVKISRYLQTDAGKMIFAELIENNKKKETSHTRQSQSTKAKIKKTSKNEKTRRSQPSSNSKNSNKKQSSHQSQQRSNRQRSSKKPSTSQKRRLSPSQKTDKSLDYIINNSK